MQYIYSSNTDPTILSTKTVKYIMETANELSKYISKSLLKSNPRLFKDFKRLNEDWKNARTVIGKRGR